jgi:PHD/YefM family antitoxin component YafN of YafNO toxin-antitoxin module
MILAEYWQRLSPQCVFLARAGIILVSIITILGVKNEHIGSRQTPNHVDYKGRPVAAPPCCLSSAICKGCPGIKITLNFTYNMITIISKGGFEIMPNIKPISDLRNYNAILRDVAVGAPVFLTKNGRGRYALIAIEEYEKNQATIKLMSELAEGEKAGREKGWLGLEELENSMAASSR